MKQTSKTLTLLAVIAVQATMAHAQYATYNHDSPKQNQITVMETGTGALTPELYYWALHNKYKKTAATKNKLSFRTIAGANLYGQVDDAEAIDSALVKRAEIEALNVADRQIDLACTRGLTHPEVIHGRNCLLEVSGDLHGVESGIYL